MLKRSITSVILVGFVVCMVYFGAVKSYIFIDALILAFATLGCYEIYRSFRKSGFKNNCIPLILLAICIYPLWHFFGMNGIFIAFSSCALVTLTIFTFKSDMEIKDLLATIFTLIYPYGFLVLAFLLTKNYSAMFTISFAIFVPVFSDTFAYLLGTLIKGKKLCPTISPKKTVAGAIGGLFGAILASIMFFLLFDYYKVVTFGYISLSSSVGVSVAIFLVLGIIGGVFSELGDLAASRIKRALNIKDYGNIFPGHGGALDRIDSIMFMLVLLTIAFEIIY
ncbi:MAG: phosphatidate cytidylyltransferase [Clostridia bacterium]